MSRAAEDFKQQAATLAQREWVFRGCSICDCGIRFVFLDGEAFFQPGCECSDTGRSIPVSWETVAHEYNSQTDPTVIAQMDSFWKWPAA